MNSSLEETLELLLTNTAQVVSADDLRKKLELDRPLRIKHGVDPTAPDIHLGHAVCLTKLRQFQDLGHEAILIIGDFTAMIGDPSGRSVTRPQLTHDQVMENASTYREQAFKILDEEKTKTVFNGEWFEIMHFEEVIKLNSRVTLQQMLQREDFRDRIDGGQPVHAHEIQYPIMQGWDSVKVRADIELGGTDQLFNLLVGRDLQKEEGQEQQVAMMLPILEGLDGTQKMSKSLNNYVALNETADEMFGKLMSIPDSVMGKYYELLLMQTVPEEAHPMEAKKKLGFEIVKQFHDEAAAQRALDEFNLRFSQRNIEEADWPTLALDGVEPDIVSIVATAYATAYNMKRSKGEVRRLVEQGSVQWRGEKISDVKATPSFAAGEVLKLDKKRAVRIK